MNKKNTLIGSPPVAECLVFAVGYLPFMIAVSLFGSVPPGMAVVVGVLCVACWASASFKSGLPSVILLLAALAALIVGAESSSQLLSSAAALALACRVLGLVLSSRGGGVAA